MIEAYKLFVTLLIGRGPTMQQPTRQRKKIKYAVSEKLSFENENFEGVQRPPMGVTTLTFRRSIGVVEDHDQVER
jgi:hypothetical protein